MINYIDGSLWYSTDDKIIVHCISADAELGKGFAIQIRDRFPEMRETLLNSDLEVGQSYIMYDADTKIRVIHMVTKEKYSHKPTRNNFLLALDSAMRLVKLSNESAVKMPFIGTGLDMLSPKFIISSLEEYKNIDVDIYIPKLKRKKRVIHKNYFKTCPTCVQVLRTDSDSICERCGQKLVH